jgi:hypothetical protein
MIPAILLWLLLLLHCLAFVTDAFSVSADVLAELKSQKPNEDATPYKNDLLRAMTPLLEMDADATKGQLSRVIIRHPHFQFYSLDDVFPHTNMSRLFNTNTAFRDQLRAAIRYDMMFGKGSVYNNNNMDDEAQKHAELAQQKPMIGLWKVDNVVVDDDDQDHDDHDNANDNSIRMKQTTTVLRNFLENSCCFDGLDDATAAPIIPTGCEFLERIGSLSMSTVAPFHWTEVVGVAATQNGGRNNEKTDHAWHQDYGCLETTSDCDCNCNNYHVFLGFPCQDNYHGTGVLPHLVPLKYEQWATRKDTAHHLHKKPIFYHHGPIPEENIVRPWYAPGREIIVFRDVDVLHSTPDIQYRSSIMRFG